jgi:uncharacterized protein
MEQHNNSYEADASATATHFASPQGGPFFSRRRFLQAVGATGIVLGAQVNPTGAATTRIKNAVPYAARPLPLAAVRLTGGPLKLAQEMDARYLLTLQPDRMLAYLRKSAGLEPKAPGYGGWDGPGKNLTGHIAGHHLSAVSLMYAATGDARYKQRAFYIVSQLQEIQDKQGDGYIGALMDKDGVDGKVRFAEVARGDIRSSSFDLNGLWSPWYVEHKLFAGLRDAYRFTGNRAALQVETRFAAWVESIVGKLDAAQGQHMLNTEFGGMSEVLADLYADTGDRRWLALSDRFEHQAVLSPLARREDHLSGLHANATIPKLIGALARHTYTGDATDGTAAAFFWDTVVAHHSFATGGHGKDEYFGPPDKLNARVDGRTDESCNVYNMLKLTRELFALDPDIKYAEYQERALFNHVLGSMDPEDGRTCYMVPVGRGVQHEYQDMYENFTCCVGTGMENHALHGYGIYYEAGDRFWINLYAPSVAEWRAKGVNLALETGFPTGETATLRLTLKASQQFTLSLRRPAWAGDGFMVTINGTPVDGLSAPGTYIDLKRTWKTGDMVVLTLPKTLRAEPLPDNPRRVALMWGPLVLAGDLGLERRDEKEPVRASPVLVAAERPVANWLKPAGDAPGTFRTQDVGRAPHDGHPADIDFVPFYRLHRRRYAAYWDLYTPQEWQQQLAETVAKQQKL